MDRATKMERRCVGRLNRAALDTIPYPEGKSVAIDFPRFRPMVVPLVLLAMFDLGCMAAPQAFGATDIVPAPTVSQDVNSGVYPYVAAGGGEQWISVPGDQNTPAFCSVVDNNGPRDVPIFIPEPGTQWSSWQQAVSQNTYANLTVTVCCPNDQSTIAITGSITALCNSQTLPPPPKLPPPPNSLGRLNAAIASSADNLSPYTCTNENGGSYTETVTDTCTASIGDTVGTWSRTINQNCPTGSSWHGTCSNSCGSGTRTDYDGCGNPTPNQTCTDYSACTYAWACSGWSSCSTTCGMGTATCASTSCLRSDGTTVDNSFCSGLPTPTESCTDDSAALVTPTFATNVPDCNLPSGPWGSSENFIYETSTANANAALVAAYKSGSCGSAPYDFSSAYCLGAQAANQFYASALCAVMPDGQLLSKSTAESDEEGWNQEYVLDGTANSQLGGHRNYILDYHARIYIPSAGNYVFYFQARPQAYVIIDGDPNYHDTGWSGYVLTSSNASENTMTVSLTQGAHTAHIGYYKNDGNEHVALSFLWNNPSAGNAIQPVPLYGPGCTAPTN